MVDCMAVCHLVLERVLFSNEDLKKGGTPEAHLEDCAVHALRPYCSSATTPLFPSFLSSCEIMPLIFVPLHQLKVCVCVFMSDSRGMQCCVCTLTGQISIKCSRFSSPQAKTHGTGLRYFPSDKLSKHFHIVASLAVVVS